VIEELVGFGVNFNRTAEGEIAQRAFGAQSFNRTCFAADRTGHALLHSLYKRAMELGVRVYNEWQVVSLVKNAGRASGVVAIDMEEGAFRAVGAKAVIFATGGAGRVYGKTTNPENTGDGMAIAYNAGAGIMDMEMVQFHPTTLRGSNKLLSEAARGEGAYLINAKGERFMKRYAPDKMELASRDVVSRAEAKEIMEGRGVLGDSVYLDFRHLDPELINTRLPDIRRNALELVGIDITKDPVPVQPGQHYTMAGIACDVDCGTGIPGFFVAGECACVSVHGANRLGGNSLMETFVFGRRAAASALSYIKGRDFEPLGETVAKIEEERARKWMNNRDGTMPRRIRLALGKTMDEDAGPFREAKMLERAGKEIAKLKKEKIYVSEHSGVFNAELQAAYEAYFMLELAECIVASAIERKESRGAHWRTDYPKRDDNRWLKHIVCHKGEKGPELSYRPVKIKKYKPVERHY
jgi:succinate dehydrogenase / fumarate reductase flavoprotein subunit